MRTLVQPASPLSPRRLLTMNVKSLQVVRALRRLSLLRIVKRGTLFQRGIDSRPAMLEDTLLTRSCESPHTPNNDSRLFQR